METLQLYLLILQVQTMLVRIFFKLFLASFFSLVYLLSGNYTTVTANVQVYTSIDGGISFGYYHITGSPFSVSIGILDLELYESYEDLALGGFGVTGISYIDSISPALIKAGDDFSIKIEPRNEYDQNFAYFEKSDNYFLVNFTPLIPGSTTNY